MQIPRHIPEIQNWFNTLNKRFEQNKTNNLEYVLRGESVKTTTLEFQQPVSPVGPGDPKVVDWAPQDPKWCSF